MKRMLLVLTVGFAAFATAARALGPGRPSEGRVSGGESVVCDLDGVAVTYQDPNHDGHYDRATVSDIDCPGTYKVEVKILDLEPGQRTLASGTNKTSGSVAVVTLTNRLLNSEIEDADRVQVTIAQNK